MNIILLSGGSGKRLWPLSNDIRSKQFLKLFHNKEGQYESMLQRVHRQILSVDSQANITITTAKSQVPEILNQIGESVSLCVEPCRRDTFPAIALASSFLKHEKNLNDNEVVIVSPIDPFVEESYFKAFFDLERIIKEGNANIGLIGIEPTYPSEKYGYIIPEGSGDVRDVIEFKEKPSKKKAIEYLSAEALWNGGVVAFRLGYLLEKTKNMLSYNTYKELYDKYADLEKISFDYAVIEKEKELSVLRYQGEWKDLGTWNTLTEAMQDNQMGEVYTDNKCSNTHIINELDIPIICVGVDNVVVSASAEGILVSDKEQSSHIKPIVDNLERQIMFARKSWGSFKVIEIDEESMTIKITLNPGSQMNYHSHKYRDEVWTIVSGQGRTIVDGMEQLVSTGDVITIEAGCKHTLIANTELKAIEVQIGKEISVYDKQKHRLRAQPIFA
ncbi:MAG: sugar phosphate nucleotidyltransferase [Suipraeoptans sp.]